MFALHRRPPLRFALPNVLMCLIAEYMDYEDRAEFAEAYPELHRITPCHFMLEYGGDMFNSLDPRHVLHLSIGDGFNLPINLSSYRMLKTFYTGREFDLSLELSHCPQLEVLYIGDTFKQPLDLSRNLKLKKLYMGFFNTLPIDISHNLELDTIYFGYAYFNHIDVTRHVKLEVLYLGRDCMYPIDLTRNIKLKELYTGFYDQPLDLSRNVELEILEFGLKFRGPIDLSHNIRLKTLKFNRYFRKHSVDLSHNTELETLVFEQHYDRPLNLTNNVNLKLLRVATGYTCMLDLTANTKLEILIIDSNPKKSPPLVRNYCKPGQSLLINIGDLLNNSLPFDVITYPVEAHTVYEVYHPYQQILFKSLRKHNPHLAPMTDNPSMWWLPKDYYSC